MLFAHVIDDDGVLVLASAERLKARFAAREFRYDFPVELLSAAGDEELCSWQTNEEGDVSLLVHVGAEPAPGARYLGVLRLGSPDELLVLPYSQYTRACSGRNGEPEDIEDLCVRLKVEPGRYACWVRPMSIDAPPELREEAPLTFQVCLLAAEPLDKPVGEVPVVEMDRS